MPPERAARVARVRKNLTTAQARLAAARQAAAASPVKVSATDPDSRLLPAKNGGGWLQGWNLQLTAGRVQGTSYGGFEGGHPHFHPRAVGLQTVTVRLLSLPWLVAYVQCFDHARAALRIGAAMLVRLTDWEEARGGGRCGDSAERSKTYEK